MIWYDMIYIYYTINIMNTGSTAQGGGGSFKDRQLFWRGELLWCMAPWAYWIQQKDPSIHFPSPLYPEQQKCIRNTSFHMVLRSCMCCCWVKLLSPWRILWAAHPMSIWAYSGSECDWGTTVDILPYRRCVEVLEFINNDDLFRFLFGCTGDSVDSKGKQPRIVLRLYWRSYNIWDELAQISSMFGAQKLGPEISGTTHEVITASLAPCLQKGAQSGEKSVVLLERLRTILREMACVFPNYRLHVGCSGSVKNRWLPWLHSVYPIHPLPRLHLRGGAFPPSRCLQALDVHFAEANGRASSKTTGVMAERSLVWCRSVMIQVIQSVHSLRSENQMSATL